MAVKACRLCVVGGRGGGVWGAGRAERNTTVGELVTGLASTGLASTVHPQAKIEVEVSELIRRTEHNRTEQNSYAPCQEVGLRKVYEHQGSWS